MGHQDNNMGDEWIGIIKPYYYKGERDNEPYDIELMLRIYILQNLYDLSDMRAMTEVIDSPSFSRFCEINWSNQVPDGDTIEMFRNILVKYGLQRKLFRQAVSMLTGQGLILKKGTILDSTIIAATSSTKNKEKNRDSQAHSVKNGSIWHFGYKVHVGVDSKTKLVHKVKITAANVHDVTITHH